MTTISAPSTTEANKRRCLEMVAAWNRHELGGIIEHWARDVAHYSEDEQVDTDEMIARMEGGLAAFPDLRLDVDSILAEGDRVVLRITITATHSGPFGDQTPTGLPVRWHIVEELRFVDGQVVEHWDVMNYLPMLRTLGRVPADA